MCFTMRVDYFDGFFLYNERIFRGIFFIKCKEAMMENLHEFASFYLASELPKITIFQSIKKKYTH